MLYDRAIGVICLGGIAVTHLADLPEKIEEAPYMAVLFCGLIVASAGLGIVLAIGRSPAVVWQLAGAVAMLPLTGYILSRSRCPAAARGPCWRLAQPGRGGLSSFRGRSHRAQRHPRFPPRSPCQRQADGSAVASQVGQKRKPALGAGF
jgi:hypothetical protein